MINSILPEKFQDITKLQASLKKDPETDWVVSGEKQALSLFHDMAKRVPAYKSFLASHKLDPSSIKSIEDFASIPTVNKDNYLRKYSREDLCWDGDFKNQSWVISATSGSTGEPYYFPRTAEQDSLYEITAELYLRENFAIDKKSTLYVNAFPLGIWIGGLFTYEAIYRVALKSDYHLSLVNPGINIPETIKAIKNLSGNFDQVVIGAYGPFLKDIVDEGEAQGIDWKALDVGFVLSAEAFSELFRDYIYKKCGITGEGVYTKSLNHYGTVDLGTMSHETPASILTRRVALENEHFNELLFPDTIKLPTLTQYIPEMFYFEEHKGSLLCTAHSGIPLVRYDLKDIGRVFTLEQLRTWYKQIGKDFDVEMKTADIEDTLWNLPFVYVYERNDFSVSFFAFQIYPETVRKALLHTELEDNITGKFTMQVEYNTDGEQEFTIHIELKDGAKESTELERAIAQKVIDQLLLESSEYRKVYSEYGAERATPIITLWPYHDDTYFKAGTKQKWVKK